MSTLAGRPKTPMFEALHADRYHRQELIRTIQALSGAQLVTCVGGAAALIDRGDPAYLYDLLYSIPVNMSVDLLLHTEGGDIDAAEKLMSTLRLRVGVGRLRVIVPDFAKSAGTLLAIGADAIVMSDTSELGPIDPQVTMADGSGHPTTRPVQAYLDAYQRFSERLQKDPDDAVAREMLGKIEPDLVVHFERIRQRARLFAESQLRRGVCREKGTYTAVAARLANTSEWLSHGQVINVEEAERMGMTIDRRSSDDPMWDACWRLYCLQRLTLKPGQKLFESEVASLVVNVPA